MVDMNPAVVVCSCYSDKMRIERLGSGDLLSLMMLTLVNVVKNSALCLTEGGSTFTRVTKIVPDLLWLRPEQRCLRN